ncbi:MAG TPA: 2Fe-2S iron-sulfur cluster-binding protein [Bacillota bacterium]|nr:2Fe-2S iron-sulfur cluster-binding protein [Bacillota bacterium]
MKSKIIFQPKGKTYMARFGESILQCALKNRVLISHRCEGKGSCTTCKIKVVSGQGALSDPSPAERKLLSEEQLADGVRLACQVRAYGSVEVEVMEKAWKSKVKQIIEQRNDTDEGI